MYASTLSNLFFFFGDYFRIYAASRNVNIAPMKIRACGLRIGLSTICP